MERHSNLQKKQLGIFFFILCIFYAYYLDFKHAFLVSKQIINQRSRKSVFGCRKPETLSIL